MEQNWLTEQDTHDFSVSIHNNFTDLLLYFTLKVATEENPAYSTEVSFNQTESGLVCRNTFYIEKDDLFRCSQSKVGLVEDAQLLMAVVMVIVSFLPEKTDFCMVSLSIAWLTQVWLSKYFSELSFIWFVVLYFVIACSSLVIGAICANSNLKSPSIIFSLLMILITVGGMPSYLQVFFWTWVYPVWIVIGIFLFGAARIEFTKSGVAIFCRQGLKFTQLFLTWACVYAVNPLQLRLMLDHYPSRYSSGRITTVVMGHIKVAVSFASAVVLIITVILKVSRNRENNPPVRPLL